MHAVVDRVENALPVCADSFDALTPTSVTSISSAPRTSACATERSTSGHHADAPDAPATIFETLRMRA